ncbi:MAG: iron ABC transporter permease [Chloroflexi bacterium]|nr:iron ABC transporter permease [Chloroflexota bacterium]MCH9039903.1 iron ABC transporter permease [Chloroflexota bacterium]MCI0770996.1 iron ABC transporter permease [Chloroflexota bacterium]MCI0791691.1 iron ABC transporter permease [Chloroflexota bacterium]MCI0868689.1 iron ABC transporter permease [Chloroflexota bacterium]
MLKIWATPAIPASAISRLTSQWERTDVRAKFRVLIIVLTVLLFLSLTLAVTIGPVYIAPWTVWKIIGAHVFGLEQGDWSRGHDQIAWLIRMPRVLLGGLVGAGLAAVGVSMQAVVRNPLADPYILGTSAGASVGAVSVLMLGYDIFPPYSLSIAAFLGAIGSFLIVMTLAQNSGRISPTRFVLAGVATAYILTAVTSFVLFIGDERAVRAVVFWLMGSVAGAKWEFLTLPAAIVAAGTLILVLYSRSMNALLAGEETATTLGIDPQKFRFLLLTISALLTGVLVAIAGPVGFVGLMIPHMVRLVVGSDHRRVLPASVIFGAIFLIWVDVGARTVVQPQELPLSVITALLGAPFFFVLLRWRKTSLAGGGR